MKVNVDSCWSGGSSYHFRLEFKVHGRFYRLRLPCEDGCNWNRRYATEAKNMLSSNYGVKRSTIRFIV
jgi:hypothetical protein